MRIFNRLSLLTILMVAVACSSEDSKIIGPQAGFSTNSQLDQVLGGLISYGSMAEICNDYKRFDLMRIEIVRALEFGFSNNLLTTNGKYYYNNLDVMLSRLANEAKGKTYVTCGETKKYIDVLLDTVGDPDYYKKYFK